MAFDIPGFDNIEFNISSGKDKKITITIPPVDCLYPTDITAIQNEAEKQHIDNDSVEIMRLFLLYFNIRPSIGLWGAGGTTIPATDLDTAVTSLRTQPWLQVTPASKLTTAHWQVLKHWR